MVRRIILVLTLVVVIALGFVGYNDWKLKHAMMSGEVISEPVVPTEDDASPRSAPPPPGPASNPSQPIVYPPSGTVTTQPPSPEPAQTTPRPSPTQIAVQSATPTLTQVPAPPLDTIAPNPPNGLAFAGSGRYQAYRQGNITWRFDTDTGRTCALLATNEEWRNPQVYRYGCTNTHIR